MKKAKLILIIFSLFAFNACWTNESESVVITGNYFVGWNDLVANRAITFSEDKEHTFHYVIIDAYVFAIGNNDNYIIAKQQPTHKDTTNTNYFIIDINQKAYKNLAKVYGPMTKDEFDTKTSQLNISDIKFNLIYPENPYKK